MVAPRIVLVAGSLLAMLFAADGKAEQPANPFARTYACKLVKEFRGHSGPVTSVVGSQDGSRFVSLDSESNVNLWEITADTPRKQLRLAESQPTAISMSKSGDRFAIGTSDGSISLFDRDGESIATQQPGKSPVTHLVFLNEAILFAADDQGKVSRWNIDAEPEQQLTVSKTASVSGNDPVTRLITDPNGKHAYFSTERGRTFGQWFANHTKATNSVFPCERFFQAIAWSPTDKLNAGVGQGKLVLGESFVSERLPQRFQLPSHVVVPLDLEFSWDGRYVIIYGGDQSLHIRNVAEAAFQIQTGVANPEGVTSAALCLGTDEASEWRGISGYEDGTVRMWRLPKPPTELPETFVTVAQRTVDLLKEKNYDELESLIARYRREKSLLVSGEPALQVFYAGLIATSGAGQWEAKIEEFSPWEKAKPESPTPRLAKAMALDKWGWEARGSGFVNTVTPEGAQLFRERLSRANEVLDAIWEFDNLDGMYYKLRIDIGKALGFDKEIVKLYWRTSLSDDPTFYPASLSISEFLLPRWHGEQGEGAAVAKEVVERLPGAIGEELYARMAIQVSRYEGFQVLHSSKFEYPLLKKGLAALQQANPQRADFLNDRLLFAYWGKDRRTANEVIQMFEGRRDHRIIRSDELFEKISRWALSYSQPRNKLVTRRIGSALRDILSTAILNDGHLLLMQENGTMHRFTIESLTPLPSYRFNADGTFCVGSRDGAVAMLGIGRGDASTCYLYRFDGSEMTLKPLPATEEAPIYGCMSLDGKRAITTYGTKRVDYWDFSSGETPKAIQTQGQTAMATMTSDGESFWTWQTDDTAHKWIGGEAAGITIQQSGLPFISPDGKILASLRRNVVAIFDAESGEEKAEVEIGDDAHAACFAPDSSYFVIAFPGQLVLVDIAKREIIERLRDQDLDLSYGITFSPDGNTFVAAGSGPTITIWDLSQYRKRQDSVGESGAGRAKKKP